MNTKLLAEKIVEALKTECGLVVGDQWAIKPERVIQSVIEAHHKEQEKPVDDAAFKAWCQIGIDEDKRRAKDKGELPASPRESAPLLPCPFCGSTDITIEGNGIGDYFVICEGCEARTSDRSCEGQEYAAMRWNQRTQTDKQSTPTKTALNSPSASQVPKNAVVESLREMVGLFDSRTFNPSFALDEIGRAKKALREHSESASLPPASPKKAEGNL